MSSGNSGNPFPNIVSNLLTPGLKRSKRLAEKRDAGRASSLPSSSHMEPTSSNSLPPNLDAQPPVDINSSSYRPSRTTIGDLDTRPDTRPSNTTEANPDAVILPNNPSNLSLIHI